jgi:hypothetical protein
MPDSLHCPACKASVYLPHPEESGDRLLLEIICPKCQRKYSVSYVETKYSDSYLEPLPQQKPNQPIEYQRIYKLRVLGLAQTIQAIEFSTIGRDEKFSAVPGDRLTLLYIMHKVRPPEPIFILNETTATSHQLFSPIQRARKAGSSAFVVTLLGGAFLSLLAGFSQNPLNKRLWLVVIPSAIGTGVYVTRRQIQLTKEQNLQTAARLSFEQNLLEQVHCVAKRLDKLHESISEETRLIERLKTVKQKMTLTDSQVYARRIETFERGIDAMEKQLKLSQNLIAGYLKVKSMLEIDYETSRLAEQLPENTAQEIVTRLQELETIETQKEELSLLADPQKLLSY